MKKRTLSLLLLLTLLLSLVSCGEAADVEIPDGMQIADGGEALGYYFFVPEEWTVSNLGGATAAYVSALTPVSVSLAATELADGETESAYFERSLAEFPAAFGVKVEAEAERCTLGNADDALSYVYTYTYQEKAYRTRQILASFEGRYYLFTYTAPDAKEETSDTSPFEAYSEKANSVAGAILFISRVDKAPEEMVYETDADGYLLVSDAVVCGFDFYLAPAFTPTLTTGIIGAVCEDRASVTMSEATRTGVNVADYFEERKKELATFVTDLTILRENEVISFANARNACAYEYTYSAEGETFHVYQVLTVTRTNGYVFTYTAPESVYTTHLDEVTKMTEKVSFR